jgi:hypothetical protein
MYYRAIAQCTQMLKNLDRWLDKAEAHANAKKLDGSNHPRLACVAGKARPVGRVANFSLDRAKQR